MAHLHTLSNLNPSSFRESRKALCQSKGRNCCSEARKSITSVRLLRLVAILSYFVQARRRQNIGGRLQGSLGTGMGLTTAGRGNISVRRVSPRVLSTHRQGMQPVGNKPAGAELTSITIAKSSGMPSGLHSSDEYVLKSPDFSTPIWKERIHVPSQYRMSPAGNQ